MKLVINERVCHVVLLWICTTFQLLHSQSCSAFKVTEIDQCSLEVTLVTGNIISVNYQSLPANPAGSNGNSLWVWRASEIPWNTPPERKVTLPAGSTESGSYAIDSLEIVQAAYVVAYSVGPEVKDICACTVVQAGADPASSQAVAIDLKEVGSNSIVFDYQTFAGYLAKQDGNWAGLWNGSSSPYNAADPIGRAQPTIESNQGTMAINNVNIVLGGTYTLVYFMGDSLSEAASIIRFTVSDTLQ